MKAVEILGDKEALQGLCREVRHAREAIEELTKGGFPVVYALRVEPEWFPDSWERYMYNWKDGDRGAVELRCRRELLSKGRLLGKVLYPNGTDKHIQWDGFETWEELQEFLSQQKGPKNDRS